MTYRDRVRQLCHQLSNLRYTSYLVQKINKPSCTIAVDGSVFKLHPQFKGYMQETIKELMPQSDIKLMLSEDGSGKGAALIAAVAARIAKQRS